MRLTACIWLAAASAAGPRPGLAATLPRYGGALRIETQASATALDPLDLRAPAFIRRLTGLVFESLDAVSSSTQRDAAGKHWDFQLRPGVRLHDGTLLTADALAAALQPALSGAAVKADGDRITIDAPRGLPGPPPAFLRTADGGYIGTGPFRVVQWEAGKHAVLAAYDSYWGGRAFVDTVEVAMGRPLREQYLDLELGKADLVELGPAEARRLANADRKVWTSATVRLLAVVFGNTRAASDPRLREALALSIDRGAIHQVLLQRQGEISGALLPQWLTGYAFLFPSATNLAKARALAGQLPPAGRSLALAVDPAAPLARLIADRIAVNARDAGIAVQVVSPSARWDARLEEAWIPAAQPLRALLDVSAQLGVACDRPESETPVAAFAAEQSVLAGYRVVPLFHLPEWYGSTARVHAWLEPLVDRLGTPRLAGAWLEP